MTGLRSGIPLQLLFNRLEGSDVFDVLRPSDPAFQKNDILDAGNRDLHATNLNADGPSEGLLKHERFFDKKRVCPGESTAIARSTVANRLI
ncbi:MAG: hypothetical protein V2A73_00975 [Pseudomonadota bacterium]